MPGTVKLLQGEERYGTKYLYIDYLSVSIQFLGSKVEIQILDTGRKGLVALWLTHLPPMSEVYGSNPRPYMRKLVAGYQCPAAYNVEFS